MYFSHHVLLRISSFKKKMEKDAYLVLLKKEKKIVTLFMMVECTC